MQQELLLLQYPMQSVRQMDPRRMLKRERRTAAVQMHQVPQTQEQDKAQGHQDLSTKLQRAKSEKNRTGKNVDRYVARRRPTPRDATPKLHGVQPPPKATPLRTGKTEYRTTTSQEEGS